MQVLLLVCNCTASKKQAAGVVSVTVFTHRSLDPQFTGL